MATVTIENISEAREQGAKYGVAFPAGRGRPPMGKLAEAIKAAGDTVKPTDYFTGDARPGLAVTVERNYEISVKRFKEGTNKKGKPYRVPVKDKFVASIAEIRKLAGTEGLRGRVSDSSIRTFLQKLRDNGGHTAEWTDADIEAATVVRLTSKQPAKPVKASAVESDSNDEKDLVSVDASESEKATV